VTLSDLHCKVIHLSQAFKCGFVQAVDKIATNRGRRAVPLQQPSLLSRVNDTMRSTTRNI